MLSKIAKTVSYSFFIAVATLLLFEFSFRTQIIDFYKSELNGLNPHLKKKGASVLVFGDSFTAHKDSYVSFLRQSNPNLNIINCAIPGTGIRQHELFFEQRVSKYNPQRIIYQFYVGNDFLDVQHSLNYDSISLLRNTYWSVSDQLLGIDYLNYRLAFLRSNNQIENVRNDKFSPNLYDTREKINFKTAPNYLNNSVNLQGTEVENYHLWKEKFQQLLNSVNSNIPIALLLVPHCAQVNKEYQNRMNRLGAKLNTTLQDINYPLIQQLQKDFPNIQIINALADFQKEDERGTMLYFENDPHLTLEGQEVLSKIIEESITL